MPEGSAVYLMRIRVGTSLCVHVIEHGCLSGKIILIRHRLKARSAQIFRCLFKFQFTGIPFLIMAIGVQLKRLPIHQGFGNDHCGKFGELFKAANGTSDGKA
jgi:hypothetical protein